MPDPIDEYRALLSQKQKAQTELATARALQKEKQKELDTLLAQAKEKFGVSTLEELQELLRQSEAAISQTVINVRASAPGLLNG